MRILTWKHVPAGALVGFCDIQLPSGLVLHEVSVMRGKDGTFWASPPSKPMLGRDGRVMTDDMGRRRYVPVVTFVDNAIRRRFSDSVIEALRQSNPEALAEPLPEPPPEPPIEMADDEIPF